MKREINLAQLAIVDGAWQEAPDNVARFEATPMVDDQPGRGSLYIVTEVAGAPEGRDELARTLVETARREYAQSRGSIMLSLTQAVRAANDYFYHWNASTHPEARRIAGMTAAILRENELFIVQAGPGLAILVRGTQLVRFPDESPWFDPAANLSQFPTPGTVPMGMRRNYNPDQFHITLQSNDSVVLATRNLAHLLSNEELLDTIARRHPDEIITNLEDIAGSSDLSVLAIQFIGEGEPSTTIVVQAPPALELVAEPIPDPLPIPMLESIPEPVTPIVEEETPIEQAPAEMLEPIEPIAVEPEPIQPIDEIAEPEAEPIAPPQDKPGIAIDWSRIRAWFLRLSAILISGTANLVSRVDWKKLGMQIDRTITLAMRAVLKLMMILFRGFLPTKPNDEETDGDAEPPRLDAGWMIASIVLPILLIAAGFGMWTTARTEQLREQARLTQQSIDQAVAAIEAGKNLAATDKNAASAAFRKAMDLAQPIREANPNNQQASSVYYQAQDALDTINGISVLLFLPTFAKFSDPQAIPARIVTHYPDVFVLDRGAQKLYRYIINEAGSAATPTPTDGVLLKKGDPVGDRTVSEMLDMFWVDVGGKLVIVDKSGAFLQYDLARPAWSVRAPNDSTSWLRISLASSYAGNLYLADAGRNQILRYTALTEGAWTSYTTYFAPGVAADLTAVVDVSVDGDVWLLRSDGSIMRYTSGKPSEFSVRDLETPLKNPVALYTTKDMASMYIADAGNQRIVQIDKTSGKFQRQFKPRGQDRDVFKSLKTLTVDESNKKFFFISGTQAYLATIPQ